MKTAFICSVVTLLVAQSAAQFDGLIRLNPFGGHSTGSIQYSQGVGTQNDNLVGTAFATANLRGGPPTFGGALNYYNNGHGLSYQHSRTPDAGTTNTFGGKVNVYDRANHKINVDGFNSQTRFTPEIRLDRYGGNVGWEHGSGHGASLGFQHTPQINQKTIDLNTNMRLWNSKDQRTSLDWTNGVSKNIGQFNHGKIDFQTGIDLKHRF